MKTFLLNEYQTMLNNATAKGFGIWRNNEWRNDETEMIGIENKNSMVYWYEVSKEGDLFFVEVYNRNNGKTSKGWKMGFNFKYKMIYKK